VIGLQAADRSTFDAVVHDLPSLLIHDNVELSPVFT
jgi:hypothetical protein